MLLPGREAHTARRLTVRYTGPCMPIQIEPGWCCGSGGFPNSRRAELECARNGERQHLSEAGMQSRSIERADRTGSARGRAREKASIRMDCAASLPNLHQAARSRAGARPVTAWRVCHALMETLDRTAEDEPHNIVRARRCWWSRACSLQLSTSCMHGTLEKVL